MEAWAALVAANPVLEELDPDAEALVVNRLSDPPQYAILPIDQCYGLVGLIKSRWEGISGGDGHRDRGAGVLRRHPAAGGGPVSLETPVLVPAPEFEITGAAHVPFAAAPTMLFAGHGHRAPRRSRCSRSR